MDGPAPAGILVLAGVSSARHWQEYLDQPFKFSTWVRTSRTSINPFLKRGPAGPGEYSTIFGPMQPGATLKELDDGPIVSWCCPH